MELIEYSKCATCKKAKKFLIENKISFKNREIKEKTPTKEEITNWLDNYPININKLFNTSGLIYKELNLKEKMSQMNKEEKIEVLSQNAMLIKRPILITNDNILIGFKEAEWTNILLKKR